MIQPVTIEELQLCFAKMRSNKCADTLALKVANVMTNLVSDLARALNMLCLFLSL